MYNVTYKDYTFVENDNIDFYGIRLNSRFKDVVLVYGKVGIKEQPEKNDLVIWPRA